MKKVVGVFVVIMTVMFFNISSNVNDINNADYLTLSSITNAAAQNGENSGCDGIKIPPGYGCTNGVTYPLRVLSMESCEKTKDCFFWIVKTVGTEGICRNNTTGGFCAPIACDAPTPTCF